MTAPSLPPATAADVPPGSLAALLHRGARLANDGDATGAEAAFRAALALAPDQPDALALLGRLLAEAQRGAEAVPLFERLLATWPCDRRGLHGLANLRRDAGALDDAHTLYIRAEAQPAETPADDAQLALDHGLALARQDRWTEAARRFERVIALQPARRVGWTNLAAMRRIAGDIDGSIEASRRSMALDPDRPLAWNTLLFTLNYRPAATAAEQLAIARAFDRRVALPLAPVPRRHANRPEPDRRLRVGYLSGDLCRHPVASFLLPLLRCHDRSQVELFAYSSGEREDDVTVQIRHQIDHWRAVATADHGAVAAQIEADGIDIAVDLSGHTAYTRLLALARRPAPVQIAWLGYPGTTGLSAIGYRLTDAVADPPGAADGVHSESLVRLPGGFLCFEPPADAPPVGPPPSARTGLVTFGSFNMLPKLTDPAIELWLRILTAVPGSRLALKAHSFTDPAIAAATAERFSQRGLPAERLDIIPWIGNQAQHLDRYRTIDIALDTFPYTGTTTTCEALWMGVPVVTLAGDRHAARVGASLLHRVGLDDLIAATPEHYVEIAVGLARDPARLAQLRAELRQRVAASPLADASGFARQVEAAYRQLWQGWCLEQSKRPAAAPEAMLEVALARHRGGDPAAAEAAYRQLLQAMPDHPDGLHLLGVVLLQTGRAADAIPLIEKALVVAPALPNAASHLGAAYRAVGRLDDAVTAQQRAVALAPADPSAHYNQGLALLAAGRPDEAAAAQREALRLKPDYRDATLQLGRALAAAGDAAGARAALERTVALDPAAGEAWADLGALLLDAGQAREAEAALTHAARLLPDNLAVAHSHATALLVVGQAEAAASAFARIAAALPDDADAHANHGSARLVAGDPIAAVQALERALALTPDHRGALGNLGVALKEAARLSEAIACFQRLIALDAANASAWSNLGSCLREAGEMDDAVAAFDRALALDPDAAASATNRLLALNYRPIDPARLLAEHRAWADRFEPPGVSPRPVPPAGRRLRIGYVSADFTNHPVSAFLEPLLAAHDRGAVELFAYAGVPFADDATDRLRGLVDHWRDTNGADDRTVAAWIRSDGIDVLVDLAGHTGGNRLGVFGLRPAPVQVTWLGYPGTTGLRSIGWRLTDAVADPPDVADAHHSERLIRLPVFLCYRPPAAAPAVEAGPLGRGGPPTFGSFNNLAKVGPETVALWADILRRAPGTRLVLKSRPLGDPRLADRVRGRFAAHGVAPERVDIFGWMPVRAHHLEAYRLIDVALDPFPYTGTTTTCEALWMGVPVVTLRGNRHAARVGASLLTQVGRPAWIAADPGAYVETALALIADPPDRSGVRAAMAASRLRDEAGFARSVEAAFRDILASSPAPALP